MEVLQNINYKINEIFYSIQAEGHNAGMPAHFIRLAGCNMRCTFCDTNNDVNFEMTAEGIVDIIKKSTTLCGNIVITGGEPTMQNISPLVRMLKNEKYYVCVETNGFHSTGLGAVDWVTLSPKVLYTRPIFCTEIKLLYGLFDMDEFSRWFNQYCFSFNRFHNSQHPIHKYLQPIHGKNEAETIQYVMDNPWWKLSVQWHKDMGVK